MPVYEYRCAACGKKFQALVGVVASDDDNRCPHCGSPHVAKLVSRFARYRNEEGRLDELADRMDILGEPGSPAQARELAREMGKALDEDASDEMEEFLDSEDE